MNKSEVSEMLALIEKDPELKSKFVLILSSVLDEDFTIQRKINEVVQRESRRNASSMGF